jgi:hypothetical protein
MAMVMLLFGLPGPAAAGDNAPVIVVPGKRGVPVIINGRDASWAIVEGDWGLYRPGAVPVTVIYPHRWYELPPKTAANELCRCRRAVIHRRRTKVMHHSSGERYIPVAQRHYFPGGATKPVLGRLEIAPTTPPKPATAIFRSWSTESAPLPATVEAPPQVVVGPSTMERRRPPKRRRYAPNSTPAGNSAYPASR